MTIKAKLQRGGHLGDRQWQYLAIGNDNRLRRYLYLKVNGQNDFSIGTRDKWGLSYSSECMSRKQPAHMRACMALTLSKRQRNRRVRKS